MSTIRVANVEFDATTTKIEFRNDGILRVTSTGSLKLPTGTTAQRPSDESGTIRYNSDNNSLELRNATTWKRFEDQYISTDTPSGGQDGDVWYRIN